MPSSTPPSVEPAPSRALPSSALGKSARIDLRGIKSNIVKRVGPERAKKYFQHLERFISSRLSKDEFDKLCLVAIGHENRTLHNHLIRSILHNASQACGPPVINDSKLIRDGLSSDQALGPPNGVSLNQNVKESIPLSRRENALTRKSSLNHGGAIVSEKGVAHFSDLRRYSQLEQSEHVEPLIKRVHLEKEPFNLHDSIHSNGPSALPYREKRGQDSLYHSQGPVHAPLGIQLHRTYFGRSQKPLSVASATENATADTCIELGELCDTLSVKKRMEKMAEAEGLDGVSMECAHLLNNGLDVFLKQLIGPCVELVRARCQHGRLKHAALKQQLCRKLINGVSLQNHIAGQGGNIPSEANSISMQDLKAAMELNLRLLGVNASLLHEKINSYD